MCISSYNTDFCRLLLPWDDIWYLHECIRLPFLVSHVNEPDYFRRQSGIFSSQYAPVQTFIMALMIQARHLFYGIAMLDKFKGMGWKKPYLIFGMCDETFSINYTAEIPADVDRSWFYFFTTLLNHFYWFSGATIGGLVGSLLKFNTDGLDFVMTAMFTVIFLEQWLKEKHHISEWIGLGASIGCLLIFGADNFLIPTMICILVALTILRKTLEQRKEVDAA